MTFPVAFSTPHASAERLIAEHIDIIHQMHQDPVQMELLGGVRSLEQTAAYMEFHLQHWDLFGFGTWLLRDPATGDVMGRAMLRHITLHDVVETEVGYSLLPKYWGRGIATEVATACLALGRTELCLSSMVGLTLPQNTRSRNVLRKIGMVYERNIVHAAQLHVLYRLRSEKDATAACR